MSLAWKEDILIGLNVWISVSYMVLAVLGARIFMNLDKTLSEKYMYGVSVPLAITGSALFLFGCGIHHAHVAIHMIPEGIDDFGPHSTWIRMFYENIVIEGAQAIGAPMLLYAGWLANARAKRMAYIEHLARMGQIDRRIMPEESG